LLKERSSELSAANITLPVGADEINAFGMARRMYFASDQFRRIQVKDFLHICHIEPIKRAWGGS